MENLILNLSLIAVILLIAIWNGLVIQWYITKEKKYSKSWHQVGFVIRAILVFLVFFQMEYFYGWLALIASWHLYDIIINLIMGQKWYYIGKTASIDKMGKIMWILKGLILVSGLVFLF